MDIKKTIRQFSNELSKVKGWKEEAYNRMKKQAKAGDQDGAALSRKAYEYCKSYERMLKHIIDGYKNISERKYFTKDGTNRYRNKTRTPEG